ncbi:PEP/pyruvate-binding domain-containing protein [Actinomadura verrucosospora]|uniref:Phosphoenolpyruvate synthase / pyruvate phosphate dikinase n=1 Tax=Actinomadura verrucosospora TaxID=46165 RepID=A0A7D3ZZC0_ACTVE|nr:PEP/pyruvate-binding domain-containing protein [Actinomadura verrucosospora]QKG24086.1 Phosphoenolpyruvate synthase / pyruvate phosphate dikinase [Actinomadura verrucosospora]
MSGLRPETELVVQQSAHAFWTINLDDPLAAAPDMAGAKASDLARAVRQGLPVPPGFVIPVQCFPRGERYRNTGELRKAWARLSGNGARALAVRSSSTHEEGARGRYVSALDVKGWPEFLQAVTGVVASATGPATTAILVQPQLDLVSGGVLFGADPLEGRTDRVIVSAALGGPSALRDSQAATHYALNRRGKVVSVERDGGAPPEEPLTRPQLRTLVKLAARAAALFGGPQEIEFGFDREDALWLLQTRPLSSLTLPRARRPAS